MEFFIVDKGEVKDIRNKKEMYLHSWGIIDRRKSDFLEVLEERFNHEFRQELLKAAQGTGSAVSEWMESKEDPITVVDVNHGSVLVVRNSSYYVKRDGSPIFDLFDMKQSFIEAANEVVRRNGKMDEKERSCLLWVLNKLGVKVKWRNE